MAVPRRSLLKGSLAVAFSNAVALAAPAAVVPDSLELPVKGAFSAPEHEVCLNNARWHPLSNGARRATENYLAYKARGMVTHPGLASPESVAVRSSFATLIGATPAEIAFVNSTTAAENMVVASLGLQQPGQHNIVTDALHFEGSLYLYQELAKQGVDVRIVKPRGWRIEYDDLAGAMDDRTRLVAISRVSYINGFEHDLKAICDVAHSHGGFVYADAVQAAGCMPLNVRDSGVDFLAAASYKWLQGDFGLGFLYVRQAILPELHRTQWSFRQTDRFDYHAFPGDAAGPYPATYDQRQDAAGYFEVGTYANSVLAALSYSLPWIQALGPENIQKHAQKLNARLRSELPRLGYPCITPEGAGSSIIAFSVKDDATLARKLKARGVDVGLSSGRMRVSPSVYNTMADVDALLLALS